MWKKEYCQISVKYKTFEMMLGGFKCIHAQCRGVGV